MRRTRCETDAEHPAQSPAGRTRPMPETSVRTAVVGYGLAGSVFHAPLIAATDGLALDTVVTGDPERQAQVRAAYPDVRVSSAADELWKRADELDLVVLASPN